MPVLTVTYQLCDTGPSLRLGHHLGPCEAARQDSVGGQKAFSTEADTWHTGQWWPVYGYAGTGMPRNQVRVTETPPSFVPSKNLLGTSPSSSWHSRLGLGRGAQEVSHRGREIAGLGVWAATVTVSLQDGYGFADRESAAWTCQWCRSEVSSGEPGPPRPCLRRSGQGPTGKASACNQLPLGPGRDQGLETSSQAQFLTTQHRHPRQRRQGGAPETQVKEQRT